MNTPLSDVAKINEPLRTSTRGKLSTELYTREHDATDSDETRLSEQLTDVHLIHIIRQPTSYLNNHFEYEFSSSS